MESEDISVADDTPEMAAARREWYQAKRDYKYARWKRMPVLLFIAVPLVALHYVCSRIIDALDRIGPWFTRPVDKCEERAYKAHRAFHAARNKAAQDVEEPPHANT